MKGTDDALDDDDDDEKIMSSSRGRRHTRKCLQLLLVCAFALAYLMKTSSSSSNNHFDDRGEKSAPLLAASASSSFSTASSSASSSASASSSSSKDYSNRVWIFTSVAADYDGAVLLKQFVHHYTDLGIKAENFLVVINSKSGFRTAEFDECAKILDNLGIPYHEWLTQYSSEVMYKHRMQLLEKVPPTDWIVHADNDEFHSYGGKSVIDFLKEMDKKGYNEVRGTYVDRVSKSGELSKLKEEPGMFQQFPLRCSVIKTVAGGRDFKTMAYKGYWRTDRGNHQVLRAARAKAYLSGPGRGDGDLEDVYHLTPYAKYPGKYKYQCAAHDNLSFLPAGSQCSTPNDSHESTTKLWSQSRFSDAKVAVHHFKWHAGVINNIKDRLAFYKGDVGADGKPRFAWYTDSEKLMNGIVTTGKIDTKKTKCKVA